MNFDLYRTIKQKKSIFIFFILLLLMLSDLTLNLLWTFGRHNYNYMTFLTGQNSVYIQMIVLWLLPIWVLLFSSERYINDRKLGYENILKAKLGNNKYIFTLIKVTFLSCFLLYFVPLAINFFLAFVTSWDVSKMRSIDYFYIFQDSAKFSVGYFGWKYPFLINVLFILSTSLIAGLIGVTCLCVSFVFPDKRIVYPVMFLFWFVQIIIRNSSVMNIFQPFAEWDWSNMAFVFIRTVILCLIVIIPTTIYKLREIR